MKFSITALTAFTGLLLAQSALGAAIPACDNDCGEDATEAPVPSFEDSFEDPVPTNYPTDGNGNEPCDTCEQEPPVTTTPEDDDCSDSTLYQIHPAGDHTLCVTVQVDYTNVVNTSSLVHLEPCDRRMLGQNWNLQTVKGDVNDNSLYGPTFMRLEDSEWCLDSRWSLPVDGYHPHLYKCSEDPINPWLQQDWYIGDNNQLQIRDPDSGKKTCLDVEYGDMDARVLQMWECDLNGANTHQAWTITESPMTLSEDPERPPNHAHVDRN
ncbi:hypothetical protein QFC22_006316 [Naganishia vaughanmartiniae]|uniref:Uncharacterized protein n=1 Tax=Naganishia vaughanmartiniae TaxID=1424756 RepID=A0ACC2WP00_9TREE|nr:hypothetical protein QFC22_006316 [Naganishia vaughanmartiniae]